MSLFDWKPNYELNLPEIDRQHRRLVGLINELYEELKEAHGKDALGRTLHELKADIEAHFEAEERIMQKYRYPDFEAHAEEHRQLGVQVAELSDVQHKEGILPTPALMSFLCNWLRHHMAGTDKKFGLFLKQVR